MSTTKQTPNTSAPKAKAPKTEPKQPLEPRAGMLCKIKPEAKQFIGGEGIPDWVRNTELFIERINPNGTISIGWSESLTHINTLMPGDVEAIADKRTSYDAITECPDVSIRIFGVPERIDCIRENQKRLGIPDECIFIDENHDGVLPTAKRAWSYPTDKPYVLVLQDDVELCNNFADYVNRIVKAQPNAIISLFCTQFERAISLNRVPQVSPYVQVDILTAQGIIMKTEWIEECLASWTDARRGDDTNIIAWAKPKNIPIITTLPMTLQHIGDVSVFDNSRSMGRSEFYRKNPVDANWDNPFVTPYTNIARQ